MKMISQEMEKNYRVINIVLLCICLYLLVFHPFISKVMEQISPILTKCPYLQLTGKPCPLCGGTRFLRNIKNVFYDIHYVFNIFGLISLALIIEILFRIINLKIKRNKNIIINLDIIIHGILFIIYIIYAIYYIYK